MLSRRKKEEKKRKKKGNEMAENLELHNQLGSIVEREQRLKDCL